jgi:hypothetical protein
MPRKPDGVKLLAQRCPEKDYHVFLDNDRGKR